MMLEPQPTFPRHLVPVPYASPLRRSLLPLAVPAVAIGLFLAGPGPASAATATVSASNAYVTRGVCTTSVADPQSRAASFTVGLREFTRKATSYGFKAQIQERAPRGRWTTLTGAQSPDGIGSWQDAQPGSVKMLRKITVRGLRPGSSYRLRVNYRWVTPAGKKTATRTSRSCPITDLRPNLSIGNVLGWTPGTTGGQVVYRVQVISTRLDALRSSDVALEVRQGGQLLGRTSFRPTSALDTELVPGRRCVSGQPITVVVDPDGLIDEQNEQDNSTTVACNPATR